MSERERSLDYQMPMLTVGDKINHSYILANDWIRISDTIVKVEGEQSEQEVREAVLSLESSIPNDFKDTQFYKERAESVYNVPTDTRLIWCNRRIGKPKCPNLAKASCEGCANVADCEMKRSSVNPYRLKLACINLLKRLGYFGKVNIREISDGNAAEEIEEALKEGTLNEPIG